MKKRKLLLLSLTILLISIPNVVKGFLSIEDYVIDSEEIMKCDYYKEGKDSIRVSLKVDPGSNRQYKIIMFINGNEKTEKIEETNKGEIIEYMATTAECPKYIAEIDSKYKLSDSKDELSNSKLIMENVYKKYNKNYCFYNFDVQPMWGFFVSKEKFSEFENDYQGSECPASVIAELNLFNELRSFDSSIEFKAYASSESTGMANVILTEQCKKDAYNYYEEVNGDTSGLRCYNGLKKDLTNSENLYENPNYNPETPLTCDGLFDAETKKVISNTYFIIEIIAVLMVIILTIKDYATAILNSNQDDMKKSNKKLITRVILVIVILLLPALLRLILRIFNIEAFNSDPLCSTVEKANK